MFKTLAMKTIMFILILIICLGFLFLLPVLFLMYVLGKIPYRPKRNAIVRQMHVDESGILWGHGWW